MLRYILRRIFLMIFVVLGVSFVVFFVINLAPGDVLSKIAPEDATLEEVEALRVELGLDRPIMFRYLDYMKGFVKGDLGKSYITGDDVFKTYMAKLPATLKLAFASIFVSILISIPLGIMAAKNRGSWKDNVSMVAALLGLSMPNFWLGLLLILLFSLKLGWFPTGGAIGFKSLILPAITVGTGLAALLTRTVRSSMLEVIRQDYLRTARAKGVKEKIVINKHAFKNALIPTITIAGTQLTRVLGGAVITETIFAWPGVGRLILDAVYSRDVTMITGCIILKSITISIILLIVDLLYAAVDPRIRAQFAKGGK
ncbi:ABC transporter permease [Fusibacter ferrireducens]|uniref:ABC transporter permease n=1 Tax=Fusibacter ferrireducens TaxID=2785058 RepID=A0ABR9ZNY2_9FIRM|nr:ABC transporter permease [Fusibacter ferrireducens]MBF4692124.1 ABC transporter permease [Fusibacter ferrireducens]